MAAIVDVLKKELSNPEGIQTIAGALKEKIVEAGGNADGLGGTIAAAYEKYADTTSGSGGQGPK